MTSCIEDQEPGDKYFIYLAAMDFFKKSSDGTAAGKVFVKEITTGVDDFIAPVKLSNINNTL